MNEWGIRDEDAVILRCDTPGCPRTMTITFNSDTMPSGTVEIHSPCPWHEKPGDMGNPETYYDANGAQILTDEGLPGVEKQEGE